MSIQKSKTSIIGWTISPCFIITLHKKDLKLLKAIKNFFNNLGKITIRDNFAVYRIRNKNELLVIIEHFKKYPLYLVLY